MDKAEEQRKMKMTAFYTSSGWPLFKVQVEELMGCAQAEIEMKTSKAVNTEDLSALNASVEKRNAFASVLSLEQEFKEEMEENSPVMALTDEVKE